MQLPAHWHANISGEHRVLRYGRTSLVNTNATTLVFKAQPHTGIATKSLLHNIILKGVASEADWTIYTLIAASSLWAQAIRGL